jgi:undecaprenyl-diphosphatase
VHIVNAKCGGKYGFVSSHAANSFALAMLSSSILNRRWYTIMILAWATSVSYSRIYLGVHYPGDILGGALLGILIGYGLYYFYRVLEKKYFSGNDFYLKRE